MLRNILKPQNLQEYTPAEGELYKVLHIEGHSFSLYYGYYEACDRENPAMEPMPIYPDFSKEPKYTAKGFPFVTQMQDACPHYQGRRGICCDCGDCKHFLHGEELIGICGCPDKRRPVGHLDPTEMPLCETPA